MGLLLRSALLGVATGGRSATGLAALAVNGRQAGRPWVRRVAVAFALAELVADKLPVTPSRLSPPALAGRVAAGVAAGAGLARRSGASPVGPALVSVAAVVAGSVAGARWREFAARRGLHPLAAAVAEDAVVLTLAALAARRR